jgi:hypothetical protein
MDPANEGERGVTSHLKRGGATIGLAIAVATAFAGLICGNSAYATESDAAWSEQCHGLQGRLTMRRSHVFNGTGMVTISLELRNVANVMGTMRLTVLNEGESFRVTDSDGREVPTSGGAFDGWANEAPQEVLLPLEGSIKYRIGPTGWGVPGDQAALVDLGPDFGWVLPHDGKKYFLEGAIEVDLVGRLKTERCRLELPRVLVPTGPEPLQLDDAELGRRIDELGAKMLALSPHAEEALRELSLIDDPRVVPWYLRAMESGDYHRKFNALDRLCRLPGDDALAGLVRGVDAKVEDNNIRIKAAHGLARSPHPRAKSLLLALANDESKSVRLFVVQTAAKMSTPEAQKVAQQGLQDEDETVRKEAARLLGLDQGDADRTD